jgi:hypothetical protein
MPHSKKRSFGSAWWAPLLAAPPQRGQGMELSQGAAGKVKGERENEHMNQCHQAVNRRRRVVKTMTTGMLTAVLVAATLAGTFAQETSTGGSKVLTDGAGAKSGRFDNMHMTRFIEIFLAHRDAKTGKLAAECYNSIFTAKGIPKSKDTAPQSSVEGLDFAKMKTDYGVNGASLNGPKLWLPDWTEIDMGVEREFNGIKATWVAQLKMGDNAAGVAESTPYKPMTIARKSGLGWNKGTTVMLLDDAEGNTWIMKGFQLGLKPQYTYKQFVAAGASNFRKLPPGWKFRIKTLDKDLIEKPENGVATIMPDEFFHIYDKTGPGMSNYKP